MRSGFRSPTVENKSFFELFPLGKMESTEEGERKANFMANKWAEQNVPDMAIIMSDSRPDLEKISSITVSQKSTAARCGKTYG